MMERRIGDRGRRVEKTINRHTGEEETADNTYGIEDGMEDHFDREFQTVMRNGPLVRLPLMCSCVDVVTLHALVLLRLSVAHGA